VSSKQGYVGRASSYAQESRQSHNDLL